MPRRHQVQNPSAQSKRTSRTSTADSTDQYTNQSTSPPATQQPIQSPARSSASPTKTRVQPPVQSSAKSKARPANPPRPNSSQSHSTSSGKALSFDISIPITSITGADTSDKDKDIYFELKSQQLAEGLIVRPLMLTDSVRIERLSVRQGPEGDASIVSITVSRPVSQEEVYRAISGPFHVHLAERINEPLADHDNEPPGTARSQDMISVLMKSDFTQLGPPKRMQWMFVAGQCEMVASIHSLLCHVDRQVEWEAFLREINQHLAAVLPAHSITDSSGQKATHVITSNHDRKLRITLKFDRPCSAPTQSWIIVVENSIMFLFMLARHRQLSNNPTDENARTLQEITHLMLAAANSAN